MVLPVDDAARVTTCAFGTGLTLTAGRGRLMMSAVTLEAATATSNPQTTSNRVWVDIYLPVKRLTGKRVTVARR
jgi:hypothetical protein